MHETYHCHFTTFCSKPHLVTLLQMLVLPVYSSLHQPTTSDSTCTQGYLFP